MTAALVAIGLFVYYSIVGLAAMRLLAGNRSQLRNVLLAPAAGFAVFSAFAAFLNVVGLPVERFAWPLGISVLIAAAGAIFFSRPVVPWRQYLPFLAVIAIAFLLNGLPFFRFGFDWVSISNDDANSYAVSAYRLLHFGFWALPSANDLLYDANPYARFFYHYTQFQGGIYHTFDLTLAFASRITGIDTFRIYMPVMMTGLLALVSASGALLLRQRFGYIVPLSAALAVSLSSLSTLGFIHQLGPQVFGHALLVMGVALFMDRRSYRLPVKRLAGGAALAGLAFGVLGMTYAAYFVILIPSIGAFLALSIWRRQVNWKAVALFYSVSGAVVIAVMNVSLASLKSGILVAMAYSGGRLAGERANFPFYVVPSGLANFWGIYPIARSPHEPWLSLGIAAGALLLVAALAASLWLAWRGTGVAILTSAFFGTLGIAAIETGDFALFKLTMYIQPFLWPTMIAACYLLTVRVAPKERWHPRHLAAVSCAPVIMLGLLGLNAQHYYVERSEDIPGVAGRNFASSFVTLEHASNNRILDQIIRIRRQLPDSLIITDTDSHALMFYESYYLYGTANVAPSSNMQNFMGLPRYILNKPQLGEKKWDARAVAMMDRVKRLDVRNDFTLDPGRSSSSKKIAFAWYRVLEVPPLNRRAAVVLVTTGRHTVLNRSHVRDYTRDIIPMPLSSISNHLILLNTIAGNVLNFRDAELFTLDDDFFYPGHSFAAAGRYLLFNVLRPSRPLRVVLDMTASINAGTNRLPPARVIGNTSRRFDVVGSGSGRFISPPLEPQRISASPFLGIDMGRDGTQFPNEKTGLMKLYGRKQGGDPREIVAFVRNISLISDQEYANLRIPSHIEHFPTDLANEGLQYSGIYEDGWLSDDAYVVLQSKSRSRVRFSGFVPDLGAGDAARAMTVLVDGRQIAHEHVKIGRFNLNGPPLPAGRHRIEVKFDRAQPLSRGDHRKISAGISFIGLEPTR